MAALGSMSELGTSDGEHLDSVLKEALGLDDGDLTQLREQMKAATFLPRVCAADRVCAACREIIKWAGIVAE